MSAIGGFEREAHWRAVVSTAHVLMNDWDNRSVMEGPVKRGLRWLVKFSGKWRLHGRLTMAAGSVGGEERL